MKKKQKIIMMIVIIFAITGTMVSAKEWRYKDEIRINSEHFPDEEFREYILYQIDQDGNRRLSQKEIMQTTEIDISDTPTHSLQGIEYFTELKDLSCYVVHIFDLDVSKNTKLEYLNCDDNQISKLDLTNNKNLKDLSCSWNMLTELDLAENLELTELSCIGNQLTTLDLSKNIKLKKLECSDNKLEQLILPDKEDLEILSEDESE